MADSTPRPTIVIAPQQGWESLELGELWRHRHVLYALMRRDLAVRYRQTLLGPLWFVIAPLGRMGVFSLVFGKIADLPSEGVPYPLFTYAALLPWELFAAAVQRGTNSLVKYQAIVPKVYFPRLLIPLSEALSALIDFGCSLVLLLALLWFYGVGLNERLVFLPLLMLPAFTCALAVGLLFSALQVRYRDAVQFIGYFLQAWSFATPIAYSATLAAKNLPAWAWQLYQLNPMFGVVEGFRWIFLGAGRPPDWTMVVVGVGIVIALAASALVFQRTQHLVVDLL